MKGIIGIMTKEEAIDQAKIFLIKKNVENPDKDRFTWVLSEPVEVEKVWYFDFKIELSDPSETLAIGGAPGFIVDKETHAIEVISWEKYNSFGID